jgi:hypothetical protein
LTGGRPGAVIETEEQIAKRERMEQETTDGTRKYPAWFQDYGYLEDDENADYDTDDPEAWDAASLGTWTIQDLRSTFDYEWDPNGNEEDPNIAALNVHRTKFVEENPKDDDGVEIGYDPIFGPSSPIDQRTIVGNKDSYMIDDLTRDDSMLVPQFKPGDPELQFNEEVVQFRRSLDIMETYVDQFLPETMKVPRHVAKWHGYPEQAFLEPKNFTNNRYTENPTDFDSMTPHEARTRAVQMARAKNAEWMAHGVSHEFHRRQREPYEKVGTLVGTLRKGECDASVVKEIQPALQVLGSCCELLSIQNGVFRFAYHGLMKNKFGIAAWTETMIADCGVLVTGVVFETGFRRRDQPYDGGDPYYGFIG